MLLDHAARDAELGGAKGHPARKGRLPDQSARGERTGERRVGRSLGVDVGAEARHVGEGDRFDPEPLAGIGRIEDRERSQVSAMRGGLRDRERAALGLEDAGPCEREHVARGEGCDGE